MIVGAAVVVMLFVAWTWGHGYARSLQRALDRRYARSPAGIIVGAEGIARDGTSGAAVLLVHGAGDTPQTLERLATRLNQRGYSIVAPLLPGHGRTLADFAAHTAEDWYDAVRVEYARLRTTHSWVGVVGLSMGGALSARLAAETPDLAALVLASPYLTMPRVGAALTWASWLWGPFVPFVGTASDRSVLDTSARAASLSYGAMSASALRALQTTAARGWQSLAHIRAPTLVVQSTTDNRVSTIATERAYELLASSEKSIQWIQGAGHVITVDFGWERVADLIGDWMDAHRNTPPKESAQP